MNSSRIAYLLTAFPTISETFVEGEVRALLVRGLPIDLYATRNLREGAGPEDPMNDRGLMIHRSPYLLHREVVFTVLRFLRERPRATLAVLLEVVLGNLASPRFLLQTLALFPKTLVFARRMQERRTVHVHATWGHYPATAALVISRLLDVPFSFSAHAGLDVTGDTTFQATKVRGARFVLTCNESNRRFLSHRTPDCADKIRVVHHGVSLVEIPRAESRPVEEAPTILSVGRLAREKGFLDLLHACDLLRGRGHRFALRIYGEGPERRRMEREIERRGLQDRVRLEGTAPHARILEACARATVVVLASYRGPEGYLDGIANVLVEAMACGTPVVSTDYPGARELLQDGLLGPLVPQRDPARLADAIEALLRDPARRAELARLGRRRIEASFDRERNIEAIASLFRSVLEASDGRPAGITARDPRSA